MLRLFVLWRMNLTPKIKIALDETRMLVLGVQILIGFQLRGAFEAGFDRLPHLSRYLDAVALLLMIFAFGLLVLPGPFHRVAEQGNSSGTFHGLICRLSAAALAPFAIGLGLVVGVITVQIWGAAPGIAFGSLTCLVALCSWYGVEEIAKRVDGHKERAMTEEQSNITERPKLEDRIKQMLTEARIVLPGVQALLGFQLAIVLTASFDKLSAGLKAVHGVSLLLTALSIVLLMTPAAYHRIVFRGEVSQSFERIGSVLITVATIPLALALSGDVFVVCSKIFESKQAAGAIGFLVLATLIGLWHIVPTIARRRRTREEPSSSDAGRLSGSMRVGQRL